jgi:hypothetical protein
MVSCIRPYAPEAAGAITGLAGWTQAYEIDENEKVLAKALDHPERYEFAPKVPNANGKDLRRVFGLRALPFLSARTLHTYPPDISTEALARLTGTKFNFPRAPGSDVDQPHYLPECGVGPESLDPSKDPENK